MPAHCLHYNFNMKLTDIKDIALFILFPNSCFCCRKDLPFKDKNYLCKTCLEDVHPVAMACKRCGAELKSGGASCFNCRGTKAKDFKCSLIRASLAFTPAVRALVHSYKYNSHTHLAEYMADFLFETFKKEKEFAGVNLITAVPLHKSRFKNRGYNQSELLAQALAKKANIECSFKVLERQKNTKSQTKLSRKERLENMEAAFSCLGKVKNKTVLIVDDVCTTGATIENCAAALKECGAKKVYALVLARE